MRTNMSKLALCALLACVSAMLLPSCGSQDTIEQRRKRQRHVLGESVTRAPTSEDATSEEAKTAEAGDADSDDLLADLTSANDSSRGGASGGSPAGGGDGQDDGDGDDDELDLSDLGADDDDDDDDDEADDADDADVADVGDEEPARQPVRQANAGRENSEAGRVLDDLREGREAEVAEAAYHAKLGDDAFASGRFEEAIEHYQKAVDHDTANPDYWTKLRRSQYQIGDRRSEGRVVSDDLEDRERVHNEQLLREIDLRIEKAEKLLTENDVDGAYEAASLAVDSIALHPELAGKDRQETGRRLLDRIRKDRRAIEQRRHDQALKKSNDEAEDQLERERQSKKAQIQDLLRKALAAIRRGEYRKVEELCETVLKAEPSNKIAGFWLRSARERLLKERKLRVIEDRIAARDRLEENFLEGTTPYDRIFVFPDDDYWQRVRMRRDRLRPRELDEPLPIQQIKTALNSAIIDVTFDDSPLRDVVDHFKSVVGINILINPDIDPDDESLHVSQPINQLSAMNALQLILKSKELGFKFQENTLVITTAEEARPDSEFEVYNVSDLLMKIRDFAAPEIRLKGANEDDASAPISFTEDFSEDEEPLNPDTLIELIQESSGGEDVWDGDLNKIEHQRGQLLVSASRDLHLKVRDVLNNLRQDSDLYVVIEARFIDINDDFLEDIGLDTRDLGAVNNLGLPFGGVINDSSTGGNDIGIVEQGDVSDVELVMGLDRWAGRVQHILDGFTGTISGDNLTGGAGIGGGTFQATWLEPFQVNVILRAVQEKSDVRQLTAPVVTAHNNERVYVSVITQRAYIADYELVSGGTGFAIIEVADPVVQTFQEGVILDVDPTISHDKKYITLDVRPTLATLIGGIISTINISLGSFSSVAFQVPVGIPQISLQQSFTSVTVPNGGTVLLGGFKSLDEGKFNSFLPIIGNIPILKNLARRKATISEKRSLVILVTARIVDLRQEEERRFNPQ